MHPRVLIVGTVPYDPQQTSRAFDAYFHDWEPEALAQIFSHPAIPCRGHCGKLYQITDARILSRWFRPGTQTGRSFRREELPETREPEHRKPEGSSFLQKAYRLGGKHTALTHAMRGLLWRERFWHTEELDRWMDDFSPECVFLAFSDDFFIPKIALYAAKRYGIPIVSCIGDDYYFNTHFSLNPIYLGYKYRYRALVRRVLAHPGSAMYISDKIRDLYNKAFSLDGETVYLYSSLSRKPFAPVDPVSPRITYFGNIRMGRDASLCAVADALAALNPGWRLDVYSNERDEKKLKRLRENERIRFHGRIPYEQVCLELSRSDATLIVEGFRRKDVELSRYSLSTKAADALAAGAAIISYGSADCGIVEYMKQTGAALVCTGEAELRAELGPFLADAERQRRYYEAQIRVTEAHHNLKQSCAAAERVIRKAIEKGV